MSKRLIAFLVTAIMVFQMVPVVYADTPIFEVNPNVLNESGMPYGIRTVNVPLNGNVKVTDVDGVKKLAVEDTMTTSAGPTVAVDIPSMRGNFVVNVKLTPGNAFRFDFFDARSATYTDGGGVDTMIIGGKTFSGTEIRQKLGLRSTVFSMYATEDMIHISTRGFGHRVGMSQYGAEAMAVRGSDYQKILYHYYPGTQLTAYTRN